MILNFIMQDSPFKLAQFRMYFLEAVDFLLSWKKKYGKNAYSCECVLVLQLLSTTSQRMTGKPGSNKLKKTKSGAVTWNMFRW